MGLKKYSMTARLHEKIVYKIYRFLYVLAVFFLHDEKSIYTGYASLCGI